MHKEGVIVGMGGREVDGVGSDGIGSSSDGTDGTFWIQVFQLKMSNKKSVTFLCFPFDWIDGSFTNEILLVDFCHLNLEDDVPNLSGPESNLWK